MSERSTVVVLEYPVTSNGETLQRLNVRRPKVKDLEMVDGIEGEMAKSIRLLANLSDTTDDHIRDMDAGDFQKAADLVGDFLG